LYLLGRYQFDVLLCEVGDYDSLKIGRNVVFVPMAKA
jgi:hypothetical protein